MSEITAEELYDLRTLLLSIRDDETVPTSVRGSAADVFGYTSVFVDRGRAVSDVG